MRHHDARIERCEIECSHRISVIAPGRLYDYSAFVFFIGALDSVDWDEQVVLCCLPVELAGYLDLLATRKEIGYGHTCHTSHLC